MASLMPQKYFIYIGHTHTLSLSIPRAQPIGESVSLYIYVNKLDWRNFADHYAARMSYSMHTQPTCARLVSLVLLSFYCDYYLYRRAARNSQIYAMRLLMATGG
jgi:hypothetical protein